MGGRSRRSRTNTSRGGGAKGARRTAPTRRSGGAKGASRSTRARNQALQSAQRAEKYRGAGDQARLARQAKRAQKRRALSQRLMR